MLLRGETMRSGRRHSKINRRNLRRDREISLTMRALVRAKWSEMGGGWGETGWISEVEEVETRKPKIYMPMQFTTTIFTPKRQAQMLYSLMSSFPMSFL